MNAREWGDPDILTDRLVGGRLLGVSWAELDERVSAGSIPDPFDTARKVILTKRDQGIEIAVEQHGSRNVLDLIKPYDEPAPSTTSKSKEARATATTSDQTRPQRWGRGCQLLLNLTGHGDRLGWLLEDELSERCTAGERVSARASVLRAALPMIRDRVAGHLRFPRRV
jgi:hypothetical protein